MQLDRSIFKAYDIRGIVGKSLTQDVVRAVGQVLGTRAARQGIRTLCVGRDGRLSGPSLAAALIEGIVLGLLGAYGICSLPVLGFKPAISIVTIVLATVFSSAVGIFFGIYPAKKAARLSPIEALRRN